jgi:hypothetical protein
LALSKGWHWTQQPTCCQRQRGGVLKLYPTCRWHQSGWHWTLKPTCPSLHGIVLNIVHISAVRAYLLAASKGWYLTLQPVVFIKRVLLDDSTYLSAASKGWYWTGQNRSRASEWCTYILHRMTKSLYKP